MRRPVCVLALVGIGAALVGWATPAFAQDVPYADPAAVGTITLCDAHGHHVEGGSLGPVPFVAKAIGSLAVSAPYNAPGSVAYLDADQPREGVTPPEWTGEELISGSFFNNAAHPAVEGTKGDISLRQFVQDAPPQWDGFVQLRLLVKAPNGEFDPLHYSSADIQVSGDSWHVVRAGNLPCDSGKARSIAALLAPSAASGGLNSGDNPAPSKSSASPGESGADPSTSPGASPSAGNTSAAAGTGTAATPTSADGNSVPVGYIVLGALVVVLAAALVLSRRIEIQTWLAARNGGGD